MAGSALVTCLYRSSSVHRKCQDLVLSPPHQRSGSLPTIRHTASSLMEQHVTRNTASNLTQSVGAATLRQKYLQEINSSVILKLPQHSNSSSSSTKLFCFKPSLFGGYSLQGGEKVWFWISLCSCQVYPLDRVGC